ARLQGTDLAPARNLLVRLNLDVDLAADPVRPQRRNTDRRAAIHDIARGILRPGRLVEQRQPSRGASYTKRLAASGDIVSHAILLQIRGTTYFAALPPSSSMSSFAFSAVGVPAYFLVRPL